MSLCADTVKTYQFAGSQPKNLTFGVQYKVAYMANDTLISQQTCFQVNGTNTSEISIQAVLPDLTGFKVRILLSQAEATSNEAVLLDAFQATS